MTIRSTKTLAGWAAALATGIALFAAVDTVEAGTFGVYGPVIVRDHRETRWQTVCLSRHHHSKHCLKWQIIRDHRK